MLLDRLMDIGNIMTLGKDTPIEQLHLEVGARQMTLEVVMKWLEDVEGRAEQHRTHAESMRDIMDNSHIWRAADDV